MKQYDIYINSNRIRCLQIRSGHNPVFYITSTFSLSRPKHSASAWGTAVQSALYRCSCCKRSLKRSMSYLKSPRSTGLSLMQHTQLTPTMEGILKIADPFTPPVTLRNIFYILIYFQSSEHQPCFCW